MKLNEMIIAPNGELAVQVFRLGLLVDSWVEKNLIVTLSKPTLARLLGLADTNKKVSQIGFGIGTSPPNVGNTALTSAFIKNTGTATYPVSGQVQFPFTLLTSEANGKAITEFGLFTTDTTLFSRRVRGSAINKDNTISLTGTWTITF